MTGARIPTQDEIDAALAAYGDETDECWNCGGEGFIDGDCTCGEDCCCCLEPEPPVCDVCEGKGHFDRATATPSTDPGASK